MSFKVAIRKNETGEIRIHSDDMEWGYGCADPWFAWTDGNYGCDCNRSLFWRRAGGDAARVDESDECGDTLYSIAYVELEDGRRITHEGASGNG